MDCSFLNADLDLEFSERVDVGPIFDALTSEVLVLNRTPTRATFELASQPVSPEVAARAFAELVEPLTSEQRALWRGCVVRRLNFGFQVVGDEPCVEVVLPLDVLSQLVRSEMDAAVTLYRVPE